MLVTFCGHSRVAHTKEVETWLTKDENPLQIEVELKFAAVLGDYSDYLISGGTLSQIFRRYCDFSLEISPDNHIRLKFKVPLCDVVKKDNP